MNASGHWTVVREVISSTDTGAQVMGALPGLVRRLLDEEAWKEFVTPSGQRVTHEHFTEFITAAPPCGLGGRVAQLVALCGTDLALARKVKRLAREGIEPAQPHGSNQHSGVGATNSSVANTADHHVARLKRDAQGNPEDAELLGRVLAGEVTPNAVAGKKGWRKPRIELRSPKSVAARIRAHWSTEQITELIALLQNEE